jgi:hypothetical protein
MGQQAGTAASWKGHGKQAHWRALLVPFILFSSLSGWHSSKRQGSRKGECVGVGGRVGARGTRALMRPWQPLGQELMRAPVKRCSSCSPGQKGAVPGSLGGVPVCGTRAGTIGAGRGRRPHAWRRLAASPLGIGFPSDRTARAAADAREKARASAATGRAPYHGGAVAKLAVGRERWLGVGPTGTCPWAGRPCRTGHERYQACSGAAPLLDAGAGRARRPQRCTKEGRARGGALGLGWLARAGGRS